MIERSEGSAFSAGRMRPLIFFSLFILYPKYGSCQPLATVGVWEESITVDEGASASVCILLIDSSFLIDDIFITVRSEDVTATGWCVCVCVCHETLRYVFGYHKI